jgi:hypothetical protein
MKNHFMRDLFKYKRFIWQTIIVVTLTSCVSVQVPFGPAPKAEKASAPKPDAPFAILPSNNADEAWISEKTGNTISYLSECKKSDERIEDVALDASKAIENSKILKSTHGLIDSKQTSELIVNGKVDSHKVKMAIAVFKSKDCLFSLTYGGLEEKFEEELKAFEEFKKGFRTP